MNSILICAGEAFVSLKIFMIRKLFIGIYSERPNKAVIARSEATWQSHEIASLRSQ